jgi:hypothetical protein
MGGHALVGSLGAPLGMGRRLIPRDAAVHGSLAVRGTLSKAARGELSAPTEFTEAEGCMRGRSAGPTRGAFPNGLIERLLIIALGLLVVLGFEYMPFAGLRASLSGGPAPLAAATSVSTPVPTAAPTATVAPTATEVPTSAEAPPPAAEPGRPGAAGLPDYRVAAGGDGANLRSAPSRTADVVVSVRDGTVLTNLDQQQTADGLLWRKVASGNVEGWVAAELLSPVN